MADEDTLEAKLTKVETVSEVGFSLDYLEIGFHSQWLRIYSRSTLEWQGVIYSHPEPGSIEALCTMVDTPVTSSKIYENDRIEIRTDPGHILTIPIGEEVGGIESAIAFIE